MDYRTGNVVVETTAVSRNVKHIQAYEKGVRKLETKNRLNMYEKKIQAYEKGVRKLETKNRLNMYEKKIQSMMDKK